MYEHMLYMSKQTGMITMILGCMFSGKTSELLRRKRRAELAHKKCLLIKYCNDTRYSDEKVSTHDMIMDNGVKSVGKNLELTIKSVGNINEYQEIYVDEIQFYTDGAEICDQLANNGYNVTVSALQGDTRRVMFETIIKLLPYCEQIIHLTAIDPVTGKDASFTAGLTHETEQEVIGGTDKYVATDRLHYLQVNHTIN